VKRSSILTGVVAVAAALGLAVPPASLAAPPAARWDTTSILVKFRVPSQAAILVAKLGDKVAGTVANGVTVVKLGPHDAVPAEVARFRKLAGVVYAEPNFVARAALANPNDPSFSRQWALAKIQATSAWGIVPAAYGVGGGVRIAILDTGIDATHPELADRVRTDLGGNCLSLAGCTAGNTADDNGHGTHVSGIAAAATNNAVGIAGLAFNSTLVPVKVLDANGYGDYSGIADGITWAVDHGVRVINMSLAGTGFSKTLCDAVYSAVSRGVVVAVAAGNDSSSAAHYPAACAGAIGVSATTSSDALASYSDTGSPNVFVSAPGDQIYSTYKGDSYATMSGTSMATPYVSALAALLLDELPGRSVADVKQVLATTSDKVGGGYGSDPYGTCSSCSWSSSFGYGRVNAYRALAQSGPQPDFGLTLTPAAATMPLGGAADIDVTVSVFNGFTGSVSLSASGLPDGTTAQFVPSNVNAPGDAQLVLASLPTTPSGSYLVTITGVSGAMTRTATVALSVTGVTVTVPVTPAGDGPPSTTPALPGASVGPVGFTLLVAPSQRTVARGSATEFLLRAAPIGTLTAPIVLSVSGLPADAVATFAPAAVTAPGEGALAIVAQATTPPGTYTLTITGSCGSLVQTATATLVVT
jgi:thermitase